MDVDIATVHVVHRLQPLPIVLGLAVTVVTAVPIHRSPPRR
jgi:hypothetical protein